MTAKEVLETYGQSIYEIQLDVATELFAQWYANQINIAVAAVVMAEMADLSISAGRIFSQQLMEQKTE